MTSYFTSSVSIFTSRRRVGIQTTSEITPKKESGVDEIRDYSEGQ